ncbi:diguanylate cyclase/phosphodiesterase (GGDEF & EAL domains) with PAS/PAC sensor(s) [hydrothermal vent metagenome]|uniref:Diguanylate cyclase/phosphodiesterase (GGDEF & EAL domains) with PAS/PAC sensor(S) n=1 Tax=hydrothermal vent metagenome TaxID=652676 RepID=A0A3B0YZV2_9ZZZZ
MNKRCINIVIAGSGVVCESVRNALEGADFESRQFFASKRQLFLEALAHEPGPDVIVSELELDDFSALDIQALLRKSCDETVPVILIAETGTEAIALSCLENGINQFVVNAPSSLRRLATLVPIVIDQTEKLQQQILLASELQESKDRYLDVFDNTSDLIQCLAHDGSFLYTNKAWRDNMGYSEKEVSHLHLPDVLHPDSELCCEARFAQLKAGETLQHIDFKFITKSGDTIHLKGDCGSIFADGKAVSTRGIFRNITETVKAEKACKVSEARYQTLYDSAPDIYSIINAQGLFESINLAGAVILGYTVDELVGKPASLVIHPDDLERVIDYITRQFSDPTDDNGIEYRKIRKDGSELWVHQRVSPDPDNDKSRLLVLCRDITEQRELRKQLFYQATHDDLTQLLNRREFDNRLRRLLTASRNSSDNHVLCYLDLDQFKVINDTCGHLAGDELLRQIAAMLGQQIRSRDTLARLGGDEFAILMEHCPLEQAEALANRIRVMIEDFRFQWQTKRFTIGVSIGVVPVRHSSTVEDVLSLADSACYEAKQRGRNRVHVFHRGEQAIVGKIDDSRWANRIDEALNNNTFKLYAQEIAPCSVDGKGSRLEILLRLRDDETMVNPGAFMPVAERYNLSGKIDHWVLDQTLQWFEQRPEALAELQMCSVNLSALSLCDENFLAYMLKRINDSKFPAAKLCFEVTETAAISNLGRATQFMHTLREQGCRFALDDFGSGLSSLAYLKNLPVDMVKIDGAFIRNITDNDIDRMMVKSICDIASVMDIKTTAEYVESESALRILRETGVDFVQGFHIGRPVPIDEFAESRQRKADILHFRR